MNAPIKLPPGPTARWGGINHLRAIRADFRAFAHQLHQQFGDIVHYRVLGQDVYQFATPDLAHEVLVEKARSLHKPDNQKRAFGRIIGQNLFTSDGDAWTARRRLLAPVFQPQVVDGYRAIVRRHASEVVSQLGDGEVDIAPTMNRIAMRAVAEALFGSAVNEVLDEFLAVASELQGAAARQIASPVLLPLWIPTRDNRTVRHSLRFFHQLMTRLVDQRRTNTRQYNDLLAALLRAADAETGTRLTDWEAIDEALTILLAGIDTTAAALSWSALLLAQHPNMQQRLFDEVSRDGAGRVTLAEAVFQEAMRLYPPAVAIARQAAQAVEIGGVAIPRGGLVFVIVYSIHHDSRWFPQPEQFQPERFAAGQPPAGAEKAYLPFGLGPRACIGRRFAMMEGPLVLAEFVRRFQFQLADPAHPPALETQLSLHPQGGLRLWLTRRSGQP